MSNRLEQFIHDNREQFDAEKPNPQLWKKLERKLSPGKKQRKGKVIAMAITRWSAAAAIIILAGVGIFHLLNPQDTPKGTVPQAATEDILNSINPAYAQEVNHFTRLIEMKQSELKQLQKDHPNLYQQFITDIQKLDSSYNALKKELPGNPNREQLLEAMIQNLQLQTDLLNQQLQIIQQINQSKNNSHENNSKTI